MNKEYQTGLPVRDGQKVGSSLHPDSESTDSSTSDEERANEDFNNTTGQELTPDSIKEQLQNYIVVPRDKWHLLTIGTHIRYISKDNRYHQGGFIKELTSRVSKKPQKPKNGTIYLENHSSRQRTPEGKFHYTDYSTWPVYFRLIKHLYKQLSPNNVIEMKIIREEMSTLKNSVMELRNELYELSNENYTLREAVEKLEEENKKVKSLVRELLSRIHHNKKINNS